MLNGQNSERWPHHLGMGVSDDDVKLTAGLPYTVARVRFFRRQPRKPSKPAPLANNGRAAGTGVEPSPPPPLLLPSSKKAMCDRVCAMPEELERHRLAD